jgi:hypothetical protein
MPFQPGHKFGYHNNHKNAGRRAELPKEVVDLVKENTPKFIKKLMEIALGPDKKMAMAAIDMLLQRVFGQPKQYVENDNVQEQSIDAGFASLLRDIAERVSGTSIQPPAGTAGDVQSGNLPE